MSGTRLKVKKKQVCIICCVSYDCDKQKEGREERRRGCFNQFCKEIKYCLVEKGRKGDCNLGYADLSVCSDCQEGIRSAMEERMKAEKVERRVRKMQIDLLADLEELRACMDEFARRMEGIEAVVKVSDEPCLREYIEENVEGEMGKEIIQFRERILAAVDDLRMFRQEIRDKTECDKVNEKMEQGKGMLEGLADMEELSGNFDEEDSRADPYIEDECDARWEDAPITGQVRFDSDFGGQHEVETVRRSKRPKTSCAEAIAATKLTITPVLKIKKRMKKRVKLEELDALQESCGEVEVKTEPDDHDGDGGAESDAGTNLSDPALTTAAKKIKKAQSLVQSHVDLSGMCKFRRLMIGKIIKNEERVQKEGVALNNTADCSFPNSMDDDPRRMYPLKYNLETGQVTVGDVELIINDDEKSIRCSICDYTVDKNSPWKSLAIEKRMQDHICGKHLGAYKCRICPSTSTRKFASFKSYNIHMFAHREPDKCMCDICGMPFTYKDSIYVHKWTHMNEEERAEAMKGGKMDPREIRKNVRKKVQNMPLKFQCSTCGKGYRYERQLKFHERIHSEDRERMICPQCGKLFLPGGGWEYHQKYGCPLNTKTAEAEVKCDICSKTCKNKRMLQRHVNVVHELTEKNLICQKCGKAFKTQNSLGSHLRYTHSDTRPYPCPKSCGASFNTRPHAKKHGQTCNGQWRRNRRGPRLKGVKNEDLKILQDQELLQRDDAPVTSYICQVCGKELKTKWCLKSHLKYTHSETKSFPCPKSCGAKFKRREHAQRHGKTCKNAKNFGLLCTQTEKEELVGIEINAEEPSGD